MEILFEGGVHVPGDGGLGFGKPPISTHYEMWVDSEGLALHLLNFEIVPVIDPENKCFMEDEVARYPFRDELAKGLHATKWYDKLVEIYTSGGRQPTQDEAGALADAQERIRDQALLHEEVRAVVASHWGRPMSDDPQADLQQLLDSVPAPDEMSDASNRDRWDRCQQIFENYPLYYVGTDRLITLPLNGFFFGVVNGTDPRNGGFIGGASIRDILAVLNRFDHLRVNWQFNDPNDARADQFGGKSDEGYHYMVGQPIERVRGVINVPLRHRSFTDIKAEAAIYTNLDEDNVHF